MQAMSRIRAVGKLTTRPWRRQGQLLEALILLTFARILNLTLPVKKYAWTFGKKSGVETPLDVDLAMLRRAKLVGNAVERVAEFMPFKAVCFQQAIAAQIMLKRRGIPGTFYLGINRDKELRENKALRQAAHAWVRVGRRNITGGQNVSAYVVLGYYS